MKLPSIPIRPRLRSNTSEDSSPNTPAVTSKPVLFSLVGILLLALGSSGALDYAVNHTPLSYVDQKAGSYADSIAKQGTVVYGSLRAINSALYYAKSLDTGVGVNFHPLAFVEGYKDTIEIVSNVLLAAAASGYLYNFVLEFGQLAGLSVLLPAGVLLLLVAYHNMPSPRSKINDLIHRLGRLFIGWFVILRVGVPLALFMASALDGAILQESHDKATQNVTSAAEETKKDVRETTGEDSKEQAVEKTQPKAADEQQSKAEDTGWFDSQMQAVTDMAQSAQESASGAASAVTSVGEDAVSLGSDTISRIENIFNDLVTLVATFIMKIIVFPLLILWALSRIWRVLYSEEMGAYADPESRSGIPGLPIKKKHQEEVGASQDPSRSD